MRMGRGEREERDGKRACEERMRATALAYGIWQRRHTPRPAKRDKREGDREQRN